MPIDGASNSRLSTTDTGSSQAPSADRKMGVVFNKTKKPFISLPKISTEMDDLRKKTLTSFSKAVSSFPELKKNIFSSKQPTKDAKVPQTNASSPSSPEKEIARKPLLGRHRDLTHIIEDYKQESSQRQPHKTPARVDKTKQQAALENFADELEMEDQGKDYALEKLLDEFQAEDQQKPFTDEELHQALNEQDKLKQKQQAKLKKTRDEETFRQAQPQLPPSHKEKIRAAFNKLKTPFSHEISKKKEETPPTSHTPETIGDFTTDEVREFLGSDSSKKKREK